MGLERERSLKVKGLPLIWVVGPIGANGHGRSWWAMRERKRE
jgi:hypothetical protein